MTPSDACVALTRLSEGLRLTRYLDIAGHASIGYGHLITDDDDLPTTIPEAVAESLLSGDLSIAAQSVDGLGLSLSQGQFDALCDFVFNFGLTRLLGSTLLRRLRAGDFYVADPLPAKQFEQSYGTVVVELPYGEFSKWVWATHPNGTKYVEPGLVTRRAREGMLWRSGTWS